MSEETNAQRLARLKKDLQWWKKRRKEWPSGSFEYQEADYEIQNIRKVILLVEAAIREGKP